jgi:ComF family protein
MHQLIDIFFPKYCLWCKQQWAYLCLSCKKWLKPHSEICPGCHRPSSWWATCITCYPEITINWIHILFQYRDTIRKSILRLKYHHQRDIASFLAKRMSLALKAHLLLQENQHTIISYVPSHWWKSWFKRGYNQSKLLAYHLGKGTAIPVHSLWRKKHHTTSQARLDRQQRLTNLSWAFAIRSSLELADTGTLIIVDDVLTTGTTLIELTKLFKQHYPQRKVRGITVARHGT